MNQDVADSVASVVLMYSVAVMIAVVAAAVVLCGLAGLMIGAREFARYWRRPG
jgi:hypothetical protein